MIKAVIFDIDNTLYSYDENHIYGMEALAVYCRDSFGITTDEMQACYRKAGRIMTDRNRYCCNPQPYAADAVYAGTSRTATFSACAKYVSCLLGHIYSAYTVKSGNPGIYERAEKKKNPYRNRDRHDCIRSVQKTGSNWCDIIY